MIDFWALEAIIGFFKKLFTVIAWAIFIVPGAIGSLLLFRLIGLKSGLFYQSAENLWRAHDYAQSTFGLASFQRLIEQTFSVGIWQSVVLPCLQFNPLIWLCVGLVLLALTKAATWHLIDVVNDFR